MKFDSKYFDIVRTVPREMENATQAPLCDWRGCEYWGVHRAPKGRNKENEYFNLCYEHVREYNRQFNYFAGMADNEVQRMLDEAIRGRAQPQPQSQESNNGSSFYMGRFGRFGVLHGGSYARGSSHAANMLNNRGQVVNALQRDALDTLGLAYDASREAIRQKFKQLVKRNHPDLNGGDRSAEVRLRDVIQAYKQLRKSRLC